MISRSRLRASVSGALLALALSPALAQAAAPATSDAVAQVRTVAVRTADEAVRWFEQHRGSSAYENLCERAVRLAWDRSTHHTDALDHWNSSDGTRHSGDTQPPRGAFVFWNTTGGHGHVGIADGEGGYWATNVRGAIGHFTSLSFFSNYLGWKAGDNN